MPASRPPLRFLAEAEAVARLQHPNIVQIHHIGEADGLPYFELEYIDGGSLDRRLDGTPWPARRAAELIESVARGVAEAHRQGIVHRDLKPGNILLAADGTPKITDFGLAKSLAADSGLTRTDSIMGSPGYMAPEQAEGKTKQVGPPADVYALGAILYELLTGGPPFRGTTVLEILEQVKNAEPVPPSRLVPGLPRDVETIALKCLQKEPAKRYDSAAALAEDLRRFLGGEPIMAPAGPVLGAGLALVPAAPGPGRPDRGCRPGGRPRAGRHPLAVGRGGEGPRPSGPGPQRGGEGPRPGREAGRRRGGGASGGRDDPRGHVHHQRDLCRRPGRARAGGPLVRQRRPAGQGRPRSPARQRGPRPDLGPPGVHAAPCGRGRRIMARGPGLPSGRAPPNHEGRDRRQDLGYSQHSLGPGDRAARSHSPAA